MADGPSLEQILTWSRWALDCMGGAAVVVVGFLYRQGIDATKRATEVDQKTSLGLADLDRRLTERILTLDVKFEGRLEATLRRLDAEWENNMRDMWQAHDLERRENAAFRERMARENFTRADAENFQNKIERLFERLEHRIGSAGQRGESK